MKVCLTASAGGHLSQLLKVVEHLPAFEKVFVTTNEVMTAKLEKEGHVYVVTESNREHPLKAFKALLQCVRIVMKEKPDVVISSGALAGAWMCILGKLCGAKIIWIDSITNVERLSLSARIVRPIANLMLTQWEDLAEQYANVEYAGQVI